MANGQTPSSKIFPPTPAEYESPWWYASLQSFWLYYLVDPEVLRSRLPTLPEGGRLEVALFDLGGGKQSGLASIDLQRYTGHGPKYLEATHEVEFNFYVYPEMREPGVPLMTVEEYLRGLDQTKTIGGYRLHVPCDDAFAVSAGKGLYNEPKFLAVFEYAVPCVNGPPWPPSTKWSYQVFQDVGQKTPPVKGPLMFAIECDPGRAPSVPADPSPLIEYGVLTPTGGEPRVVANYWDFYGPFDTYLVAALDPPWRAELTLGTDPDPSGTVDDLKLLIGDTQPIAAQVYTSAPVSAESRGWFVVPS
jgi:hypothetical protein